MHHHHLKHLPHKREDLSSVTSTQVQQNWVWDMHLWFQCWSVGDRWIAINGRAFVQKVWDCELDPQHHRGKKVLNTNKWSRKLGKIWKCFFKSQYSGGRGRPTRVTQWDPISKPHQPNKTRKHVVATLCKNTQTKTKTKAKQYKQTHKKLWNIYTLLVET